MADLLRDFVPLFTETEESIRARLDADVNAGLERDDPAWIDVREGSFYFDITQVVLLEIARLWDALSLEVPAAAFPQFAWGDYLDEHAAIFNLVRKEAVAATGTVLFYGTPGAIVATGTEVSADSPSGDTDAISFLTDDQAEIGPIVPPPSGPAAAGSTSAGALPAGTYVYSVTAINALGESVGSGEVSATIASTGEVVLTWTASSGATGYRVYRGTIAGGDKQRIAQTTGTGYTDNGSGALGVHGPPTVDTTAAVRIAVTAAEAGEAGNVGAFAISNLQSPNPGIHGNFNEEATAGGAEVETDDALRERILFEFEGQGAGNQNDYRRWALAYAGVGRVGVIPVWNGPGTVMVVVMDANGRAVSSDIVTGLQTELDPVPGQGAGTAPIGAVVTVSTPTIHNIDVAATITHVAGYSLDGTGGTIATRPVIEAALEEYINHLQVGEDVVYEHVKARLFVEGVYSVAGVQVNGGTADVVITASPPEVAQLNTAALA